MATYSNGENELIDNCYNLILKLIKKSGELVKRGFYNKNKNVSQKEIYYMAVTDCDIETEKSLIGGIQDVYPNHKFVAEETKTKLELTDEPTWIIDPIDGTVNFIHQNPFICISVGFAIKKEIAIGMIYNPIHDELFTSRKGQGSFLNGNSIRCSLVEQLHEMIYAHDINFLYAKDFRREINFNRICKFSTEVHDLGSAALTLAYVARGAIDGYTVHDLSPWDLAAGALLITEAGGFASSLSGTQLDIMKGDILCAGTKKFGLELVNVLKDCENWNVTVEK